MFQNIIKQYLDQYPKINYSKKEIRILNIVIYSICYRILFIMVNLVNHCDKTVIKDLYLDVAMQIDFPNLDYQLNGIIINKDISNLIRNIYYQNVSSIFEITKECINLISKLIVFFIKSFINNSIGENNRFDYKLILNFLEKYNYQLSKYIIYKYKIV